MDLSPGIADAPEPCGDGAALPWDVANQNFLVAELEVLRRILERKAPAQIEEARLVAHAAEQRMPSPSALAQVSAACGLTRFERDVLLLCAGVELDTRFAAACAAATGEQRTARPTFSLALAILPEAHWSALGPAAPLRRLRLVELVPGETLTGSPLRVDERVLHLLAGVDQPDQRLADLLDSAPQPGVLAPSQAIVADRIAAAWARAGDIDLAVAVLVGGDRAAKVAVAAAACERLGLRLDALAGGALASAGDPALLPLLLREEVLTGSALLVDCEDLEEGTARAPVARVLERLPRVFVMADRRPPWLRRFSLTFEVSRPTPAEQRATWRRALGQRSRQPSVDADAVIEPLVAQFDLGTDQIETAADATADGDGQALPALWDACRAVARPALDRLAVRVEARRRWDALVLPEPQLEALREIALHVRRRAQVFESWGFARDDPGARGVTALFFGASGTGKTLAAEVLASELNVDLHRIDLSQVVSKYIGETEKHLRRLFDGSESGASILLFDEADALFGRRTDVHESHDRYANLEIAYLLQRVERYRGMTILTTNHREALDAAFARRIRFTVEFPFPGAREREEIWRRVFPPEAPVDGIDVAALARFNLSGGSIRNIAVAAAFVAAEAGEPLRMAHVLKAAGKEYAKLGRPFPV